MKRLPLALSFLLFLALSASLTYWLVQWTAPAPRAVSAPPKSERPIPPVSAAASLFGGRSPGSSTATMQLRGVVHAGRALDSVAIITVEGKPPRALKIHSEIGPGVVVKEILNKTVVVSEQGAERELSLPAFAPQESHATVSQASMSPAPNLPPANPSAAMNAVPSAGASGSSNAQSSGMTSPPAARPAHPSQGSAAAAASETARPLSGQ